MLQYAPGEAAYRFPSKEKWSHGFTGGSAEEAAGGGAHESGLPLPGDGPHVPSISQRYDAAGATRGVTTAESCGIGSADPCKKGTFCSAGRRRGGYHLRADTK